ncbi:9598_t:CDS:2 [Gigaspora margarita]|uniref:9598_t:CDS:1 n=1 Tax=Gigaspora margarita TaxID=4874 RepID=A0ABN7VD17_GIGMA|nr:9598_t:CDS:2 [Gigaspora margarita]
MTSNNPYIPLDDALTTIITGIIPGLVVVLLKGFEESKKKFCSLINIFDDAVIFSSMIIYPLISTIKWYDYYSYRNKKKSHFCIMKNFLGVIITMFIGCSWSVVFEFLNGDNESSRSNINYVSKFCINYYDKFFSGRCELVNTLARSFLASTLIINCLGLLYLSTISKMLDGKQLKSLIELSVIYPAILYGYLLSTNSVTTKLSFGICSIALSRLLEHYGDDQPEKINTLVSCYMNYTLNMWVGDILRNKPEKISESLIKLLSIIADRTEFKTAKKINYVKSSVENQLKIFKEGSKDIEGLSKIQDNIKNVICTLNIQIEKLENDAKKPVRALKYLEKWCTENNKNEEYVEHIDKNKENDKHVEENEKVDKKFIKAFFKFIEKDQKDEDNNECKENDKENEEKKDIEANIQDKEDEKNIEEDEKFIKKFIKFLKYQQNETYYDYPLVEILDELYEKQRNFSSLIDNDTSNCLIIYHILGCLSNAQFSLKPVTPGT